MNKLDKILFKGLSKEGPNPYTDKENWGILDYTINYGCPLGILLCIMWVIFDLFT